MDSELRLASEGAGTLTPPHGLTRRRLLQAGGAGLLAVAAGGAFAAITDTATLPSSGSASAGVLLTARGLARSHYQPYLDHRFTLTPAGGPAVPVRLAAVDDFPGAWAKGLAGSEDAFILLFHARSGAPRPGQSMMDVVGPGGSFGQLLMSPAGPGRRGLDYAAVINRVIPQEGRKHV